MKETYKVKTPQKIVWGDPWYFEEYKEKDLQGFVVNEQFPNRYATRVVLEEKPYEKYPHIMSRTMKIYLASEEIIQTYLQDKMYASQKEKVKLIGVDTARYYLRVDDKEKTFLTGGDGICGVQRDYSRDINGRKIVDATVIDIEMPEDETLDSMRRYLQYFFENVEQVENVEPDEESGMSEDNVPGINM